MQASRFWTIGAVAPLLLFCEQSFAQEKVDTKRARISTDELRRATIIGDLGEPIGTLVTVEGRYQDMTFTRLKADDGRIELVINRVNGRKLSAPVRFDFHKGKLFERLKPQD